VCQHESKLAIVELSPADELLAQHEGPVGHRKGVDIVGLDDVQPQEERTRPALLLGADDGGQAKPHALDRLAVAAALALFQTSILLTVFLGWKVFREQNFRRRFLGAIVMVIGAVLIVLRRQ